MKRCSASVSCRSLMPIDSKRSRIPVFFAIGIGLSLLLAALKAIAAWLADVFLYSVPWIGGFLKSIELIELFNLVVFAILGAGIGAATLSAASPLESPG